MKNSVRLSRNSQQPGLSMQFYGYQDTQQQQREKKEDLSEVSYMNSDIAVDQEFQMADDTSELEKDIKIQLNLRVKMEIITKKGRRFCKNCAQLKPPRCHHCSSCSKCWLKMDHHCQWVNNCVGFFNYKYFFNMVCYGSSSLIFIAITYVKCLQEANNNPDISDTKLFLINLTYYFNFIIMLIVVGFNLFHLQLIIRNQTTLEFIEAKDDSKFGQYNLGFKDNLYAALGTNILAWILPIQSTFVGLGTDYQTIESLPH